MRKIAFNLILVVVAVSIAAFWGCKEDEDDPVVKTKKELLMDKMWYNTDNQGVGERRFNTDGTLQFYNPNAVGTYTWGPNDSMYISIPGAPPMTYWFKTVTETTMEYWPTFEPSSNIYKFSTTKP